MKKERQNQGAAGVRFPRPKSIVPMFLVVLCSASLTFIVLFAAFSMILNNPGMYTYLNSTQQAENRAILEYLNGPLFSANHDASLTAPERSHMTDVKRLIDISFLLNVVALGILIGIIIVFTWHRMRGYFDELASRSLRAAGWTILAICFLLGAMSLLNFGRFWIIFHYLLFPQGNWAFPADSVLITLYPGEFFARFVTRWLISILAFAVIAIIASYVMERMRAHEHAFKVRP